MNQNAELMQTVQMIMLVYQKFARIHVHSIIHAQDPSSVLWKIPFQFGLLHASVQMAMLKALLVNVYEVILNPTLKEPSR